MKKLEFPYGVHVPNPIGLHQCYMAEPWEGRMDFLINICPDELELLVKRFINALTEPCFFILEVPTSKKDEPACNDPAYLHNNVYYWDLQSRETLLALFEQAQTLLIHDGMGQFGFASHATGDELFIQKYNLTQISTKHKSNESLYHTMLTELGIPQEDDIKTVWQTFSKKYTGENRRIEVDGQDIYDFVNAMLDKGMRFYEHRRNTPVTSSDMRYT